MGEALSKAVEPEQLAVFKKLDIGPSTQYDINIPELPQNRVPTDRKYLIVLIVIIIVLMPFLIYTLINSDIGRYLGYDPCGNVCGQENDHYDKWQCSGKNFTQEKYLLYDENMREGENGELLTRRHCAKNCPDNYASVLGRCIRVSSSYSTRSSFETEVEDVNFEIASYLRKNAWKITLACFLSLGVAMLMLYLFRVATAAVVWGILGGVILFGALLVGGLWYFYFNFEKFVIATSDDVDKRGLMFLCAFFTIAWLILCFVMAFLHRKIQLVIQLLKEATKAAFDMPMLLSIPVLTFFAELVIVILFIISCVYMFSAGSLTILQGDFLYYKPNIAMYFAWVLTFVVAFWICQFIVGIQYMVIAGAVSKWYFTRDKNNLGRPILSSAGIVFKFHLGSIAFGSMIITLIAIIRAIISSFIKNKSVKACFDMCFQSLESFIKYLSKNSYILTAMHGKPFYKSGKRAAKIIFQNAVSIASINYIGDFVLFMAQLLIVLIAMLITAALLKGADDSNAIFIYLIVLLVSLAVASTTFAIFETCIDTIFLCFCEDSLLNDGMARPYAMSRNLMEFVENSKKIYGEKK